MNSISRSAGRDFPTSAAGVKTNLLFFPKGKPTERISYYDLCNAKVDKKAPITLKSFEGFFARLPERENSERSWTSDLTSREGEGGGGCEAG